MPPIDLHGTVIVITGASSGIGAATALECAKAGMDVVLGARRADRLEAVAARVRDLGRRAEIVAGDVTDADCSARLLDAAEAAFGRFDAVFANAGYGASRPILDEDPEQTRKMFEVNFFASVDLVRAAAQRLVEQERRGHLLMCSSCVSKFALPRHGTYAATKAAQDAVCAAMRGELKRHGIYVSSVHPITTTTGFFDASAAESGTDPAGVPDHAPSLFVQPPERVARAVVRCLRKPCPEVWTSHIVRTVAGVFTVFPRFRDRQIFRQSLKDERIP